ncbi:hypothetical protein GCM10009793_19090 [Brachybacterium phenoliresistens]
MEGTLELPWEETHQPSVCEAPRDVPPGEGDGRGPGADEKQTRRTGMRLSARRPLEAANVGARGNRGPAHDPS